MTSKNAVVVSTTIALTASTDSIQIHSSMQRVVQLKTVMGSLRRMKVGHSSPEQIVPLVLPACVGLPCPGFADVQD